MRLEGDQPPQSLWLAWLVPLFIPAQISLKAETIWLTYVAGWPVDAGIHFRKESLGGHGFVSRPTQPAICGRN